jgi:hypothetical protein
MTVDASSASAPTATKEETVDCCLSVTGLVRPLREATLLEYAKSFGTLRGLVLPSTKSHAVIAFSSADSARQCIAGFNSHQNPRFSADSIQAVLSSEADLIRTLRAQQGKSAEERNKEFPLLLNEYSEALMDKILGPSSDNDTSKAQTAEADTASSEPAYRKTAAQPAIYWQLAEKDQRSRRKEREKRLDELAETRGRRDGKAAAVPPVPAANRNEPRAARSERGRNRGRGRAPPAAPQYDYRQSEAHAHSYSPYVAHVPSHAMHHHAYGDERSRSPPRSRSGRSPPPRSYHDSSAPHYERDHQRDHDRGRHHERSRSRSPRAASPGGGSSGYGHSYHSSSSYGHHSAHHASHHPHHQHDDGHRSR